MHTQIIQGLMRITEQTLVNIFSSSKAFKASEVCLAYRVVHLLLLASASSLMNVLLWVCLNTELISSPNYTSG